MLDWIGSLRIRRRSATRVELCLSRSTQIAGWILVTLGALAALSLWSLSLILAAVPGLAAGFGLVLATLRRRLVIDRDDGLLRVEQRVLGLASRSSIPLFHLRAVVIAARATAERSSLGPRFIAYIDRRIGSAIHLDESRRCASLMPLAKAIADVAELRLVYDATARAAVR
jgi:hypothetical protein